MKSFMRIMTFGLFALTMFSCQKEETENNLVTEQSKEEGFLSQTKVSDSDIDTSTEVLTPLLHVSYDGSMSKDEAATLFHEAVSEYEKEHGSANRASYFKFEVWTLTSTLPHSQTDGNVWARANFLTDKGQKNLPWFRLNNEGNDRENGAWDFYYFGTHVSSIDWIEAESAVLALQGTDGWHIRFFDIRVWSSRQFSSAIGNSRAISSPQIWLDNNTSTGWDYYNTGNVGTGRTTFN